MATIVEIRKQVYAIRQDGHMLRQHYFTEQSARVAAMQLGGVR